MISSLLNAITALFSALAARYNYLNVTDAYIRYESQKSKVYNLKKTLTDETLSDNPNTAFIERMHIELKIEQDYLQYLSDRLPKA